MKWSFKIADIAGIKVQVHLTFLIIIAWFALAYWQLEGTLNTPTYSNYSYNALAAGNLPVAEELIEQREIFNAAEIYKLCGNTEKTLELLQQAAKDRDPALTEMLLSWAMTDLRDDPRWKKVLVIMGLPV